MNEYKQALEDVKQLVDERTQIISGYLEIRRDEAEFNLNITIYQEFLSRLSNGSLRTRLVIAWRIIRGHR